MIAGLIMLVCIIMVAGYWLYLGRYTFVLIVEPEKVRRLKGHVPDSFMTLCQTISFITPSGHFLMIRGDRHNGQLRLSFSRGVGEDIRQHLRNQFPYSAYGNARLDWRLPR